ncbi:hypothetical protein C8F04DRAFT_1161179 [Mycena alexandri]|uniref:Uncharacterized protein n=1 Tax=Mycena alexandri TaxID=1745969 RepID=A0AAD6RXQ4_9AGAR|nr:hypothetical protein C8F04DRAFT_1161179 [Mycena alexandri]
MSVHTLGSIHVAQSLLLNGAVVALVNFDAEGGCVCTVIIRLCYTLRTVVIFLVRRLLRKDTVRRSCEKRHDATLDSTLLFELRVDEEECGGEDRQGMLQCQQLEIRARSAFTEAGGAMSSLPQKPASKGSSARCVWVLR